MSFLQNFIDFHPARLALALFLVAVLLMRAGKSSVLDFCGLVCAVAAVIALGWDLRWYVGSAVCGWPLEPQILSVSALASRGGEVYPSLESGLFYGQVYGPALYLIYAGLFKFFGASVFVAKFGSLAALLGGLGIMVFLLLRSIPPGKSRLPWFALLAVFPLYWAVYSYGIRPDPWILLLLSLLALAARLNCSVLSAGLGVLSFATLLAFKSSAGLFAAPLFLLFWHRRGFLWALVLGLSGVALSFLPFAIGAADLAPYQFLLQNTAKHFTWHWRHLPGVVQLMFLNALPFLTLPSTRNRWRIGAIVVWVICQALTVLIALKLLAAGHHLMPYGWTALLICWHFLKFDRAAAPAPAWLSTSALYSVVFTFALTGMGASYNLRARASAPAHAREADAIAAELDTFQRAHPKKKIAVGFGEGAVDAGDPSTPARAELVMRGQPYVFDPTTAMEIALGGVDVSLLLQAQLERRAVDWWLIPKGQAPFQCLSSYNGQPIFSGDSTRHWQRVHDVPILDHYDVMEWKPPSP